MARKVVSRKTGVTFLHAQKARLSTRTIETPLASLWLHSMIEAALSSGKTGRGKAATAFRNRDPILSL